MRRLTPFLKLMGTIMKTKDFVGMSKFGYNLLTSAPVLRGGAGSFAGTHLHAQCGVDFAVTNVIGDGRCMFRTMAVHLFGTEESFQQVTDQCVQYVCIGQILASLQ